MAGLFSAGRRRRVDWARCSDPVFGTDWCEFLQVNLSNANAHGVYIIWVDVGGAAPLYVGKGNIQERLLQHRQNARILAYQQQGTLYATWAKVDFLASAGMERYLAELLAPLVGDAWPDVPPIEVNLPWESIL